MLDMKQLINESVVGITYSQKKAREIAQRYIEMAEKQDFYCKATIKYKYEHGAIRRTVYFKIDLRRDYCNRCKKIGFRLW